MISSRKYSSLKTKVEFHLIYIDDSESMTSTYLSEIIMIRKVPTSSVQFAVSATVVDQTENCVSCSLFTIIMGS
jgi:hypothetical protein